MQLHKFLRFPFLFFNDDSNRWFCMTRAWSHVLLSLMKKIRIEVIFLQNLKLAVADTNSNFVLLS